MPQIFHPSMNTVARVSIFGAVFFIAGAVALVAFIVRSPYVTGAGVIREQPIPFSHAHHVGDVGLDCRYCHTSVEDSSFAGIPPTKTCLNCHSQLFTQSEMLKPVHESMEKKIPIRWTRVHDVPDFVYFNHSIHLHKGIGCTNCHGEVNEMPLMWREKSLLMEWCLKCHRDPAAEVRPREQVFDMGTPEEQLETRRRELSKGSLPAEEQEELMEKFRQELIVTPEERAELVEEYHIQSKVSCSVCHR